MPERTFLTNHALALICLADRPGITGRELSPSVGITKSAVRRIIDDLLAESYYCQEKGGKRMTHGVNSRLYFRHPARKRQGNLDTSGDIKAFGVE